MAPHIHILTPAQHGALALIERARCEDIPIRPAGRSQWGPEPTVRRHMAIRLVQLGYARFSMPAGNFVLITERGRALLAAQEAA